MSTTDLFLRPCDVVVFRDGRPFSAGNDHLATGPFPPAPSALYGALRAAGLLHAGARFQGRNVSLPNGSAHQRELLPDTGNPDELGDLAITRFALAHHPENGPVTPLYPYPADVLRRTEDEDHRQRFTPQPLPTGARTNAPSGLRPLWHAHSETHYFEPVPGLVAHDAFFEYLATGQPPVPYALDEPWPQPDDGAPAPVFARAPRTSVSIHDEHQTAEEGFLFTVEFTAPNEGVGFAVRLEQATCLVGASGVVRLGGEGRAAAYAEAAFPDPPAHRVAEIQQGIASGRCTLVLATPAVFEGGWLPDGIGSDGRGTLGGSAVRLVGAALGRYEPIGGWSLARGRPKPARRAVPAGSVFFFEEVADPDALFATCFGRSVCARPEDRKQGLGLAYLGIWNDHA